MIYCQVINDTIMQVAKGFDKPPFSNAVKVNTNIPFEPASWEYKDGEIVYCEPIIVKCPDKVAVNDIFEIHAYTQQETDSNVTLYIDDEKVAQSRIPSIWKIQVETLGTYNITVDAGKHGIVKKEVIAE